MSTDGEKSTPEGPECQSTDYAAIFDHVETAWGGSNHRGRVQHVATGFGRASVECYTSLYRFPADVQDYALNNPNEWGNPSVARWPGRVWTPSFSVDFDHKEDPAESRRDALAYVDRLIAYGIPARTITVYFSGSKGFHVVVSAGWFGGFDPSTALPDRHKRLAEALTADLPTADRGIYTTIRLFREPGTKHEKTGRYKVPLTVDELRSLSIEQIRDFATSPRTAARADIQPVPIPALVELWKGTEQPGDGAPRTDGPPDEAAVADWVERLTRRGLHSHTKPPTDDGAVFIVLNRCPLTETTDDPHEQNEGAFVVVFADGSWAFKCLHNRCLERQWSRDDFLAAIGETGDEEGEDEHGDGDTKPTKAKKGRPSAASILWPKVRQTGATWFHDPKQIAYATIPLKGHTETVKIESQRFRDWVRTLAGGTPSDTTVSQIVETAGAQARIHGETRTVYYRIGKADNGAVWLDLGGDDWAGVRVDAKGWEVLPLPAGLFRRTRGMLPLPVPEPGGSLDALRPFLNVETEADRLLILGWLIGAFRPDAGYPILNLSGEQGTGKSDTARTLRRLIDPNATDLLSAPEGERNLWVGAENHWVMPLDNLSGVSKDLSNALCRLALGGGYGVRKHYSDDEEHAFSGSRPLILTGIGDVATKGDLLDRSILVALPRIEPERRRTEAAYWRDFDAARPGILGAVLTAVSAALKNLDGVELSTMPRMADFAQWVEAAGIGGARGAFADAYKDNLGIGHRIALESSSFGQALESFMAGRELWEGSASELLEALVSLKDPKPQEYRYWPQTPTLVTKSVNELAPNLRAVGIDVETGLRQGHEGKRVIRLNNGGYRDGGKTKEPESINAFGSPTKRRPKRAA